MKYEEILKDWEYLFEYHGVADDMTGGYIDQEDLARLLKNPSKAMAKSCLTAQIHYWFQVGPDLTFDKKQNYAESCVCARDRLIKDDKKVAEIQEKYGAFHH